MKKFLHRNLSIFEWDFEEKFREFLGFEFEEILIESPFGNFNF
jgi:hypothetical protein